MLVPVSIRKPRTLTAASCQEVCIRGQQHTLVSCDWQGSSSREGCYNRQHTLCCVIKSSSATLAHIHSISTELLSLTMTCCKPNFQKPRFDSVIIYITICCYLLTLSPPIPLRLYTLPYWSNQLFLIFDIWMLWCLGLSSRASKCQKIKNSGVDQYGTEPFKQQQFGTAGIGGVNKNRVTTPQNWIHKQHMNMLITLKSVQVWHWIQH